MCREKVYKLVKLILRFVYFLDFPLTLETKNVEESWYDLWEINKYFQPREDTGVQPYRMLLPPPNITGTLHLGHALTVTVQDVLARW